MWIYRGKRMKQCAKQCSLHNDKASVILAVRPSQARPGQATACWPPGGLAGMVYNMRGKLFTTYPWNSPARQSELDGGSRCWLIHQILEAFLEDNANSTSVQFAKRKETVQLSWLKLDAKISLNNTVPYPKVRDYKYRMRASFNCGLYFIYER